MSAEDSLHFLPNAVTWELLDPEQSWTPISAIGTLPGQALEVRASRDANLGLHVEIQQADVLEERECVPGDFVQRSDLQFQSAIGELVHLDGFFSTGWTSTTAAAGSEHRQRGRVHAIRVEHQSAEPPRFLTEWVVGIPTGWIWPAYTEVRSDVRTSRARGPEWEVVVDIPERMTSGDRDHARLSIEASPGSTHIILVGRARRRGATADARLPGFFEYRTPITEEQTRSAIRGAIAFLLGSATPRLGWTSFTQDGRVCATCSEDAYFPGGAHFINAPAMPPCPLWQPVAYNLLDAAWLSLAATRLVAHHEALELRHFYWLYWHARASTLDLAASEYGGALEHLRRKYYEDPSRAQRSRLLPIGVWRSIRDRLLSVVKDASVPEAVDHVEGFKILKNKLGGLNSVPGSEASRRFFEDLGLETGEVEEKALRLRDHASHGSASAASDGQVCLLRLRALQSLVNRVALAVTGAAAKYVDYSTRRHPVRPLAEPLGGPNNDRRSA